jgi:hypothetical protein
MTRGDSANSAGISYLWGFVIETNGEERRSGLSSFNEHDRTASWHGERGPAGADILMRSCRRWQPPGRRTTVWMSLFAARGDTIGWDSLRSRSTGLTRSLVQLLTVPGQETGKFDGRFSGVVDPNHGCCSLGPAERETEWTVI